MRVLSALLLAATFVVGTGQSAAPSTEGSPVAATTRAPQGSPGIRKPYRDCAMWFLVQHEPKNENRFIPGNTAPATRQLSNLRRSMQIARRLSGSLPFFLVYGMLDEGAPGLRSTEKELLEKELEPMELITMEPAAVWARKLVSRGVSNFNTSTEVGRVEEVFSQYPHPLKAAALHKVAQRCERAIYMDADILVFRDIQGLFSLLDDSRVDMLAAPESEATEWCNIWEELLEAEQFQECIARNKKNAEELAEITAQVCPGNEPARTEVPIFQSSVMVMSQAILRLWEDEEDLLAYFFTVLRVLDGFKSKVKSGTISKKDNEVMGPMFWEKMPSTGAPIVFGAGVRTSEQHAYYLKFACAQMKVQIMDRVITLMDVWDLPEGALHSTMHALVNCSTSYVGWHTGVLALRAGVHWYSSWMSRCTPAMSY